MTFIADALEHSDVTESGGELKFVASREFSLALRSKDLKTLIRKVTKNGPVAVRMALESIYRGLDTATAEALDYESSLFGLLASTDDMREGMEAFLEKRKPAFKGR